MDRRNAFFHAIKTEPTATLATASGTDVTMRLISPVLYQDRILFFTARESVKFQQLTANPNCCISVGGFFAQAQVEFRGPTMLQANAELQTAYSEKFPGAFDGGVEFGGRSAEFILLKPTRLKGWAFDSDSPAKDSIPTIPFDIDLCDKRE